LTATDDHARRRLGIFGGTFDPLHLGHVVSAQDVLEALELDRILFVPAARPPHKSTEGMTPAALRMRMVRAATDADPRFDAVDLELRRDGPSYTVDTLREIRRQDPAAELFLLLGADQWREFGSWREPRVIAGLARPVLMTRAGERPGQVDPGFTDGGPVPDVLEVPVTRLDISSTRIRERVGVRRSIRYLVPDEVLRIIEAGKLYL
jgi:nicotinate-nucleotide adenylyltransferase